jgi:hypothetical protein
VTAKIMWDPAREFERQGSTEVMQELEPAEPEPGGAHYLWRSVTARLVAVCGPGDDGDAVATLMLEGQD